MSILDVNGQPLRYQRGRYMAGDTSHRGASLTSRELASWMPGAGSADSDLLDELPTLVSRSRDITRNHGIAAGAVQTMLDNVVGTGLRLVASPDFRLLGRTKEWADEWSAQVEAHWRTWADNTACDAAESLNFSGLTSQVFRSALVNGEVLALPLWLPRRNSQFSTAIQLVETDRLCNPEGRPDGKRLRGGVEINRYGAPRAYWIRKTHPGDVNLAFSCDPAQWERLPVTTRFGRRRVVHVHDKERTGQNRGKPALTSILPMFKLLDHYELSELKAAVVNAMIAAFIETPMDAEMIHEMFGGTDEKKDQYLQDRKDWNVKLEGGSIIPIFPGDKVSPFTPSRPNSAYAQFVENVQRHIGAGMNMPFELLMKDFSKTNYSSARASLLEAWRYFNGRRQWLATHWARPVYELWLEEAVNSGLVEAPDFYQNRAAWLRCKWIGPGRGWIDPVKEAEAARLRMENGLSTLEEECASQGLDWEEVLEQRAREKARLTELGLNSSDLAESFTQKQDEDDDNETME